MHDIEPYHRWQQYYDSSEDPYSPFEGKQYNYDLLSETIYGYYIAPGWDFFGSETLYLKLLYVDYDQGYAIIEFIGEWNDALHNDIMHLKRNILEHLSYNGVKEYILLGENIMNFHGSDDCYYEEWFEEVGDGWIAAVNFREHVIDEMTNYNIDSYINFGGTLQIPNWRTQKPGFFHSKVKGLISRRIGA